MKVSQEGSNDKQAFLGFTKAEHFLAN